MPAFQAKLAAPLVSLLQTHEQPVDPNLVQLAEAWETAEAAIKAQGGSMAGLEAAAAAEGAGEEEEEGLAEAEAAGAAAVPEDLQVTFTGVEAGVCHHCCAFICACHCYIMTMQCHAWPCMRHAELSAPKWIGYVCCNNPLDGAGMLLAVYELEVLYSVPHCYCSLSVPKHL